MTTSLAAVFIPILFMSGMLGRLFREFAVTITTAILISGVVSVTLTPMLCSRFLHVSKLHATRGLAGLMERRSTGCSAATSGASAGAAPSRWRCSASFVAVLVATVEMFGIVPKGFIPDQDNDTLERQHPRGAGHVVLRDGRLRRRRSPTSSSRIRTSYDFFLNTGGGTAMNTRRAWP